MFSYKFLFPKNPQALFVLNFQYFTLKKNLLCHFQFKEHNSNYLAMPHNRTLYSDKTYMHSALVTQERKALPFFPSRLEIFETREVYAQENKMDFHENSIYCIFYRKVAYKRQSKFFSIEPHYHPSQYQNGGTTSFLRNKRVTFYDVRSQIKQKYISVFILALT